ncbi:hypothetical protein F5146DRAFT_416014 [Armillaria mellea]|nr:hypothetical protein F5146DRAFT_416014 [Armillaria mellea]
MCRRPTEQRVGLSYRRFMMDYFQHPDTACATATHNSQHQGLPADGSGHSRELLGMFLESWSPPSSWACCSLYIKGLAPKASSPLLPPCRTILLLTSASLSLRKSRRISLTIMISLLTSVTSTLFSTTLLPITMTVLAKLLLLWIAISAPTHRPHIAPLRIMVLAIVRSTFSFDTN